MTTIMPVTLTCPVCDTAFETQLLTSTNTIGMRTTDLRSLAAGFQPQAFLIHTCPSCGYSSFEDGFSGGEDAEEGVTIDPAIVARVRESITPLIQNREVDAARKWELASWVAEWSGEPAQDLGWFNLNAAWCCQDALAMEDAARSGGTPSPLRHTLGNEHLPLEGGALGDTGSPTTGNLEDRERQYRLRAAAEFERALAGDTIAEDEREMYIYLVGELYRRTGDVDAARAWFQRVIDGASEAGSEWAALAGRQMRDPGEMIEQP